MKKNLIAYEELEAEIKRQGREVTFEYPGYLQVGEIAFGHSLGYEEIYTWNTNEGDEGGEIPALATAEEVVREFFRQIDEREGK